MQTDVFKCRNCPVKSCAVSVLTESEQELLANNVSEANFDKGETLFKENSLNAHIAYLQTGLVKMHMRAPNGKDYIFKIVSTPAYLGLPTVFGDRVNNYSATALEPTTACFIDIDTFRYLIHNNGKFAYEIIADICRNELTEFKRFVLQSHKQTAGRIAGALLYFAESVYGSNTFQLPLSRTELSEWVGASRESVTRMLMSFKNDGLIRINKKQVTLLEPEMLREIEYAG